MSNEQNVVREILDGVKDAGRTALTTVEAKQIADAYQIPTPREGVASNAVEAASIADAIGYPVVMKISSADILHKTDAGGVLTGIADGDAAREAYDTLIANAKAYDASANVAGVQIQQQLGAAQEVIVGAVTDPVFGKLVAFGLGGILVEVLKDVTFRLAPTTAEQAASMLDDIRASEVLDGVRGRAAVDRGALATLIERVSTLVADFPEISELDLNPVRAYPDGVWVLDASITFK